MTRILCCFHPVLEHIISGTFFPEERYPGKSHIISLVLQSLSSSYLKDIPHMLSEPSQSIPSLLLQVPLFSGNLIAELSALILSWTLTIQLSITLTKLSPAILASTVNLFHHHMFALRHQYSQDIQASLHAVFRLRIRARCGRHQTSSNPSGTLINCRNLSTCCLANSSRYILHKFHHGQCNLRRFPSIWAHHSWYLLHGRFPPLQQPLHGGLSYLLLQ